MARSIVILTGAGMSAESGIATFRDADGLWENHRPEDVATPEAFDADPDMVHRFYNDRRRQLLDGVVAPNAGHVALARLEKEFDVDGTTRCPVCGTEGGMRPHVVWFGEIPLGMEEIFTALERCDMFAAIGTSGNVYPAAGFVQVARAAGAHTVELNLEPSWVNTEFEETRLGPAGTAVPQWVDEVLSR